MWGCRERLARLLNAEGPEHIIFTLNTSDALNLAIRGLLGRLGPDAHVVTTWMDHNSVLRPFNALVEELGLAQTRVQVDPQTGVVNPDDIRRAIRKDTRLVAVVHASNVTGTLQSVGEIGAICRELAVPLLVDAAQTVGHVPVDVQDMNIDLLAFPGHKGLLGPLGTGGLYIRPGLERLIRPIRHGGTGSVSERDTQPDTLPDKYEPGSHNAIGIIGWSEGVKYLLDRGMDDVAAHGRELTELFLKTLRQGDGSAMPGLRLLGPTDLDQRVGVFSVVVDGLAPNVLARVLEERFGILTRAGLHCAPLAHATFGTSPEDAGSVELAGATRFSLGPFLTPQDVKYATDALSSICEEHARTGLAGSAAGA